MEAERDKYSMINFEETELRLGLPGGESSSSSSPPLVVRSSVNGKRGFSEADGGGGVDLKLNLSSSSNNELLCSASSTSVSPPSIVAVDKAKEKSAAATISTAPPPPPPRAKAQVVGWPPVRSFRKNIANVQRSNNNNIKEEAAPEKTTTTTTTPTTSNNAAAAPALVKVSVDGAPYLRKVDLKVYKSYKELSGALAKMFSSSISISSGSHSQGMNEERKLMELLLNGSEYVPTYQDKDGDWMLVGDVPWEMFVESCKRLRIMKASEAVGLAPRTVVEKCKSRG